jgi:lipoyl(octanoyl) transferase
VRLDIQWLGRITYADGLRLQDRLAAERREGLIPDTVLLLEHEPVYTIGRSPNKTSLTEGPARGSLPHPVVEISRGGQATYHGPGQLVGYLILDLQAYGKDLHTFLRCVEDILILSCRPLGFTAQREENLTGVWARGRKLASIGIGVRHWVSMHGFALNVTPESLSGFSSIIPCGIAGVEMTCLEREAGRPLTVQEVALMIVEPLRAQLAELASVASVAPREKSPAPPLNTPPADASHADP